jgi:hypothetical protein
MTWFILSITKKEKMMIKIVIKIYMPIATYRLYLGPDSNKPPLPIIIKQK